MYKKIYSILITIIILLVFIFQPVSIKGATFYDASLFYEVYGNDIRFLGVTQTDGNIYYATKAKKSSNATLYTTLGWKVNIKHYNGTVLQSIYFQLNGSYMTVRDVREQNGYEYCLYVVTLDSIRNRMNEESKTALEAGKCEIIFDACTTVKKSGVPQGGMTDEGISWGDVYTTYDGIVNAEQWSDATRETLHSYYGKTVNGLFSRVTLEKDNGVESVTGGGVYCYGTAITINASMKNGYAFGGWTGDASYDSAQITFYMGKKDITLRATSQQEALEVTFYRNTFSEDAEYEKKSFYASGTGQKFTDFGWKKEGYHQIGWNHKSTDTTIKYRITNAVTKDWIVQHIPKVSLYAIWNVNNYTIVFDANGGSGIVSDIRTDYSQTIALPENKFSYTSAKFLGWSKEATSVLPEYQIGQSVDVKALAEYANVLHTNNAVITLYAIWDKMPTIEASDVYVTLEDAKNGKVTEAWLSNYGKAKDFEDGEILYGIHETNSFFIEDYSVEDFTEFRQAGSVTETFCVVDSSGNQSKQRITVHIVDTTLYKGTDVYGQVRFISQKYYKDKNGNFLEEYHGGLKKKSIWKLQNDYMLMLDNLFA